MNPDRKIAVVSQRGTSWSLPKGHVNDGGLDEDAARREIREESGITELALIKKLGEYQRYKISYEDGKEDKSEFKTIAIFLFETNRQELVPIDSDNPEARWLTKEEAADILTHEKDKAFFRSIMDELE